MGADTDGSVGSHIQSEDGGVDTGKPPPTPNGSWTCGHCKCHIDIRRSLGLDSPKVYRGKSKNQVFIRGLRSGLWGWQLPGVLAL